MANQSAEYLNHVSSQPWYKLILKEASYKESTDFLR